MGIIMKMEAHWKWSILALTLVWYKTPSFKIYFFEKDILLELVSFMSAFLL